MTLADNDSSSSSSSSSCINNNNNNSERATASMLPSSPARRRHSMTTVMLAAASRGSAGFGGLFSGLFDNSAADAADAADIPPSNERNLNSGKGPTNEIIKSVNGMRHRRLGGSDIVVSELGLGTQRWYVDSQ